MSANPDDSRSDADRAVGSPHANDGKGPSKTAASAQGRRGLARVILVVAVVVACAAAIIYAFRWVTVNDRVRAARESVDAAARLLDSAEEDLVIVDEVVQTDISSDMATRAADALTLASGVTADLTEAMTILDEAMEGLPGEDRPLAEALNDSAEARVTMMAEAQPILEADRMAALAIPFADQALTEIKAAEAMSAQATAEFNKHTAAGVQASSAASGKAQEHLAAARSLLASATAAFPGADYTAFTSYLDAKTALIGTSKEIDALWLAGKIEDSNKRLEAYNKTDAEVVAMAQALPESVRDPIADAYTKATEGPVARYFEARELARAAGERAAGLRDATTTD